MHYFKNLEKVCLSIFIIYELYSNLKTLFFFSNVKNLILQIIVIKTSKFFIYYIALVII